MLEQFNAVKEGKELVVIGYSGHAYVVIDAAFKSGWRVAGYCDSFVKEPNPFGLKDLGPESVDLLAYKHWFVAIGNNELRRKIMNQYAGSGYLASIVHPSSVVGAMVTVGQGSLTAARSVINPHSTIGRGSIINTAAVVEHDCTIGDFVHICPGAILTGNVSIGDSSLIGAGAVVIPGVTIGKHVTVGAGAVVVRDVADGQTVVGNPARQI
jgi:acetyltransferase EpsM